MIAAIQRVGLLQTRNQQRNQRFPTSNNGDGESVLLDEHGNAAHKERSERLEDLERKMNDRREKREEFVDGRNDVVVDAGVDEIENTLDDGLDFEVEKCAGLDRVREEGENVLFEKIDAFDVRFEQRGKKLDHEDARMHAGCGGNQVFALQFALFQFYASE